MAVEFIVNSIRISNPSSFSRILIRILSEFIILGSDNIDFSVIRILQKLRQEILSENQPASPNNNSNVVRKKNEKSELNKFVKFRVSTEISLGFPIEIFPYSGRTFSDAIRVLTEFSVVNQLSISMWSAKK